MCIAQKTLKSMPSTSSDINQDNDDLDESIYTPRSGAVSPISSPTVAERQSITIPSTDDDAFHFDQQSSMTSLINSSEPSLFIFFNNF
jgi:hypothetical protein